MSKIVKANGAQPDEFELSVAQEFSNLEVSTIIKFGNFPVDWYCICFFLFPLGLRQRDQGRLTRPLPLRR